MPLRIGPGEPTRKGAFVPLSRSYQRVISKEKAAHRSEPLLGRLHLSPIALLSIGCVGLGHQVPIHGEFARPQPDVAQQQQPDVAAPDRKVINGPVVRVLSGG